MSDDTVKHDGLVAEVLGGRKVVLNKGSQDGISDGDRFVVFSTGEEIHDPRTGESLGILEKVKGKGEVIHVQDNMCTIETYEFDMVPVKTPPTIRDIFGERKKKVYRQFVGVQRGDYVHMIGM